MKTPPIASIIIVALIFLGHSSHHAADLGDLSPITSWDKVARGVWRAEIGNLEHEIRYSDLAAEPPRLKALNTLSNAAFPFTSKNISFHLDSSEKLMVR
ncbi:alpha-xylosidase, partial [bacterium]|nr:alpha-xylosidase [bacterium]